MPRRPITLGVSDTAVTSARCAPLYKLPVGPVPLSTTPVPLRKPRSRHEGHLQTAARAAGFHLRLGSGVALRLCSARRFSPPALHFPARRPQTEAYMPTWPKHRTLNYEKKHQKSTRRIRAGAVRVNQRLDCGSPGSASRLSAPCRPGCSTLTHRPAPGILPLGICAQEYSGRI